MQISPLYLIRNFPFVILYTLLIKPLNHAQRYLLVPKHKYADLTLLLSEEAQMRRLNLLKYCRIRAAVWNAHREKLEVKCWIHRNINYFMGIVKGTVHSIQQLNGAL